MKSYQLFITLGLDFINALEVFRQANVIVNSFNQELNSIVISVNSNDFSKFVIKNAYVEEFFEVTL